MLSMPFSCIGSSLRRPAGFWLLVDMDEEEFARLLELFPVIRSRTYCADDNSSRSISEAAACKEISLSAGPSVLSVQDSSKGTAQSSSQETRKWEFRKKEDLFWSHLREAARHKLGPEDADKFCDAFRLVHENLVYKVLSVESIKKIARNLEDRMHS
eukprot:c38947_g1_i1 orf=62-532(+)